MCRQTPSFFSSRYTNGGSARYCPARTFSTIRVGSGFDCVIEVVVVVKVRDVEGAHLLLHQIAPKVGETLPVKQSFKLAAAFEFKSNCCRSAHLNGHTLAERMPIAKEAAPLAHLRTWRCWCLGATEHDRRVACATHFQSKKANGIPFAFRLSDLISFNTGNAPPCKVRPPARRCNQLVSSLAS